MFSPNLQPLFCTKRERSIGTLITDIVDSGGSRISCKGGVDLVGGGMDSRGGYVSKILYVKTKEFGPWGGVRWARPL